MAFPIGFNFVKSDMYLVGHGYDLRPDTPLSGVCLHSTEGGRGSRFEHECIYLRDSPLVSAHYVVSKSGQIERILDPGPFRAWHAGMSRWQGRAGCNDFQVGVEIHHTSGEVYPPLQMEATQWLCRELMRDHPTITHAGVTAHRWVALPPGRKVDPTNISDAELVAWIAGL